MNTFNETDLYSLSINPFHAIGKQWMLITASINDSWNTMTAAWGGMGYLWQRPTVHIYVRPQRHSFSFLEQAKEFTLSFFPTTGRML